MARISLKKLRQLIREEIGRNYHTLDNDPYSFLDYPGINVETYADIETNGWYAQVTNDFDKSLDTPEKDITREMIKLTRYLNDLLNNEKEDTTNHATYVTCWTCHYGKTQPASIRPQE